jgi:uroporphyrinogen decarboxylase
MMETRTASEVLGKPLISGKTMMGLPGVKFMFDKWGPALTDTLFMPNLRKTVHKRNRAEVEMGFDAAWIYFFSEMVCLDHSHLALKTGAIFQARDDGYGEITYIFQKPGITTPEEFEAWPCWPDSDKIAHDAYRYYRKFMKRYGEKCCVFGMGFSGGFGENMNWTFGINRVPLWIKRHPDYVKRFCDMLEDIWMKVSAAMLDAGVPVIFLADDSAHKTGPFLNPKMTEEIFGPRYRRIIRYVHDRGAKVAFHSCGDNTRLFDLFIDWGVDALHAYETTSNVDIFNEKKIHGDRVTIIGGVGIDYLLTEMSRDDEIVERVKELCEKLGPGGRFILGPVHGEAGTSAHKLRVMLDAAHTYGRY